MGAILAENLVANKVTAAAQITVLKKSNQNKVSGFNYLKNISSLQKNYSADLVFLCIKPQDSEKILKEFSQAKIFHKNTIFISILAGKKISFFEKIFGTEVKIIRSMPNLPIVESQGIFTYLANQNISKSELKKLEKIFQKFGAIFELEDEKLFDLVTAIFGSGPAYIFLLEEIFAEIAIGCGISADKASELIKTLFLGSVLMSCNSDLSSSQLVESVTSKAGTTAAALKILQEKSALKNLFKNAIDAAIERSKHLQ